MKKTLRFLAALLAALLLSASAHAERLKVVASFSILADLCREIGGERIELHSLVAPGGDAHAYQPSPADARAIAEADVVVINGLGFEGWIERLLRAGGFVGRLVVASDGARLLSSDDGRHADGHQGPAHETPGIDPHAWQDPANGRIYARNIALALARADVDGAADYLSRFETYASRLEALDLSYRARLSALPSTARRVVSSHDAFAYLGRAYGLEFLAPVGLSSAAQPSAAQVAALIRQIREAHIPAVFVESISDPRLIERIRSETGARVGGTLYSDALSPPGGEAPSYLAMLSHNLEVLTTALGK